MAIAIPDSRWHLDVDEFVPSFDGVEACVERVGALPSYLHANQLFVTPDNSVEMVRHRALSDGKRVVVPTYGQRRGMILLDPAVIEPHRYELAATLDGMERCGQRLDVDGLRGLDEFDMIVTGAFAVTPRGVHVDANADYLDLEWGLLAELGLVRPGTLVAALVHDAQVIDVPLRMDPHEIAIDLVVTPTTSMATAQSNPRPARLSWPDVSEAAIAASPYLRALAAEHRPIGVLRQPARFAWKALADGEPGLGS